MFTCSSVTLWKTVEKMKIRLNFYFRVVKWEVSSRGIPLSTPSGSWGAPCFRPIILQLENRNSSLISFSSLFSKTVTDKQVNKGLYTYRIRANRIPLLIRTTGDTFWAHYGNFWWKIVKKLVFLDKKLSKLTIVHDLKVLKFNRTLAFYWRGYGMQLLKYYL